MDIDFDMIPARLRDAVDGERALLYARLFWPCFVEVEDMVFLEGTFEDDEDMRRLHTALETFDGDRRGLEESFNFHEIDLLFGGLTGLDDEEEIRLAETLASMWKARLRELFPAREFTVEVVTPAPSEGHEVGVVFYERSR